MTWRELPINFVRENKGRILLNLTLPCQISHLLLIKVANFDLVFF